ncbi:MAG: transporter [Caulobacter sp.]|nr:transporter [Caulobacter sp.]
MKDGRRSAWTLAAFAAPSLPLAAFGLPLVITLPNFYSQTLGLSVGMVGAAFLFVRLVDIAFDPIFGTVLDRTRWPWGRFKPWFAIGVPVLLLAVAMLFMAKPGVGPLYLWFWLAVVYAGYSITVLSHTAWAATLSADYHQRSRVYAFWQSGNVIGMILVLTLPVLLSKLKVTHNITEGVQAQGWFIILLLPLMVALALWRVDEPRKIEYAGATRATLKDYFNLLRRPTVVRLLTADLLMGMGPGIAGTLFFFYFERIKGFDRTTASALLLFYFVVAIGGAVLWSWLAKRYGKAKVLIVSCLTYAVVQFAVVTLPVADPANVLRSFLIALPFVAAAGLPYSAAPVLLRSMMADYADEERLLTGQDRTGLLYAILTGTVKIGSALAVASLIVLGALGFHAAEPAASTTGGILGLQVLYAFAPGIIGILAAWTMLRYPLTEARHAEIRRQLADRDAAEAPVIPEDIAVLSPHVASSPAE